MIRQHRSPIFTIALGSIVALTLLHSVAPAQQADAGEPLAPVSDRIRPDYDPMGLRLGGFIAYPSVRTTVQHTDNLFASSNNEQDDTVFILTPELRFESQWSRHSLNAQGSVSSRFHNENDGNNFTDYGGSVDGRIDVTRRTALSGNLGIRIAHEERSSPDTPSAAAEPVEFEEFVAGIAVSQSFNRLSLRPSFDYISLDFKDVALLPPVGGVSNNDDRDRGEWVAGLRATYEVSPTTSVFVEGRYLDTTYERADDLLGLGVKRDSAAVEGVSGASFAVGAVSRGEVLVGYTERDYEAAVLPSIDGVIFRGLFEWLATDLTTVSIEGGREIEETTVNGASGNFVTSFGVSVDHELLRNFILGASAFYSTSEFEGSTREDGTSSLGLSGTYLANRNLRLGLGIEYEDRDSNVFGSDFKKTTIGLTVRTAL